MKGLMKKLLIPVFVGVLFSGCGKDSPTGPDQKTIVSGMSVVIHNRDSKIYDLYSDGKLWGSISAAPSPSVHFYYTDTFVVQSWQPNQYIAHSIDIRTTVGGSVIIHDSYNPKNWANEEDIYVKEIVNGKLVSP